MNATEPQHPRRPVISADFSEDTYPGPDGILAALNKAALDANRAYADAVTAAAVRIVRRAFGPTARRAWFEQSECDAGDSNCLHINLLLVTDTNDAVLWYARDSGLFGTPLVIARDEEEAYGGPALPLLDDGTHQAIINLIGDAETAVSNHLDREYLAFDPGTGECLDGDLIVLELVDPAPAAA